jgi:dihydrofolate synthase/folylpolyglutamate synthase
MLRRLAAYVDHFVFTLAPSAPPARAWDLEEVADFAAAAAISARVVPDFEEALAAARRLGKTVLVTGSFHTVGDAMARLQVSPLAG